MKLLLKKWEMKLLTLQAIHKLVFLLTIILIQLSVLPFLLPVLSEEWNQKGFFAFYATKYEKYTFITHK